MLPPRSACLYILLLGLGWVRAPNPRGGWKESYARLASPLRKDIENVVRTPLHLSMPGGS
jgi:hypothetical protein